MPAGAPKFAEALRTGAEVFHALKKTCMTAGWARPGRRRRLRAEPGVQAALATWSRGSRRRATRPARTS